MSLFGVRIEVPNRVLSVKRKNNFHLKNAAVDHSETSYDAAMIHPATKQSDRLHHLLK